MQHPGVQSAVSYPSTIATGTNRQSTAASVTATTNAAGDITSLLGKTIQYDNAGRVSAVTATPACPSGTNCAGAETTSSLYNGQGQRLIRDNAESSQTVFSYAPDQYTVLSQTQRNLSTLALSTTEHIYLPTASARASAKLDTAAPPRAPPTPATP